MTPRSWIRRRLAGEPRWTPHGPRPALSRFRPSFDVPEDLLTPSRLGTTALFEGPAAGSAPDLFDTRRLGLVLRPAGRSRRAIEPTHETRDR
jgi:hypothetical protein